MLLVSGDVVTEMVAEIDNSRRLHQVIFHARHLADGAVFVQCHAAAALEHAGLVLPGRRTGHMRRVAVFIDDLDTAQEGSVTLFPLAR